MSKEIVEFKLSDDFSLRANGSNVDLVEHYKGKNKKGETIDCEKVYYYGSVLSLALQSFLNKTLTKSVETGDTKSIDDIYSKTIETLGLIRTSEEEIKKTFSDKVYAWRN